MGADISTRKHAWCFKIILAIKNLTSLLPNPRQKGASTSRTGPGKKRKTEGGTSDGTRVDKPKAI